MRTLSKATVYCLRAMIYIATKTEKDKYFNIGDISQELDISYHFLTKTFQTITQAGLLTSLRGPYGGIALAKPAEEIFLIDIIHVLEGKNFFDKCSTRKTTSPSISCFIIFVSSLFIFLYQITF